MKPPSHLNVIDDHGGFTAETYPKHRVKALGSGDTLWRPGRLLKKTVEGTLLSFNERSFYQTNNDVTKALYKVKGYNYPVVIWFDNKSGQRLDKRTEVRGSR